ncbi:MFS transporter [Parahaliea sp. F7430]|uniref:MFS transporter n=1 Tax=Sediminihaliea albiluteola TaxID=2758564 RepID=A0A7W2TU41_9GAMM|nr:MFS transporter [Sediminihaliea albiluteola]MBA6411895.1 MFS transporter [Sediminihaliea albiluteola]
MPATATKNHPSKSLSALAEPLFRRYFLASSLSTMGTWITRFLLGWIAWDLSHAALWVGIASALMLLPSFVLSPLFGVVSDRVSPRNGLLVTLSSQAVLAAVAGLVMHYGWFSLTWLLSMTLLLGSISAAHQPLRLALIPRLVSRDALPGTIGLSAIMFNLSRILGPAAAGALLSSASAASAFLASSLLFAGAFTALLRVRGIRGAQQATRSSVLEQLGEGLRFARRSPLIRLILLFTLVNGILGRTVIELLPAVSGRLLEGNATTLATLTAAAGAGSICGGLLLTRYRSDDQALLHMVLISLAASSLVLAPIYWASGIWSVGAIVLLLAMATTMAGTGCQALAQLQVSDEFRGRVLSLWAVATMAAPALGSFGMGALADIFGFVPVLLSFAALSLAASYGLYRGHKRLMLTNRQEI